jgi:hypothetical protein
MSDAANPAARAPEGTQPLSAGFRWLGWSGVGIVATLSVLPFFLDPSPGRFAPRQTGWVAALTKGSVVLGMVLAVGLRARADRSRERHAVGLNVTFVLLAVALTVCHWLLIDRGGFTVSEGRQLVRYENVNWQRGLYLAVLTHRTELFGECWIPHVYRPLPYGFTRALEKWTGDWGFACFAYRCFFTYWFVWGFWRFVRLFHGPGVAWAGLAIYAALYPLSVWYYMGQLTDPMSHAFFALAMLALVEDHWLRLAAFLALGVAAKETAVVLVPAYLLCWWPLGGRAWLRTAALGLVAVAAFLAVRLPFGWSGDTRSINGSQLMFLENLGLSDRPIATAAPLFQNYLHPALFVGLFLPAVAWNWRAADRRLKALLVVVPLVLLSNLGFGWLYESRNYVPLLPLLVALAWPAGGAVRPPEAAHGPAQGPRTAVRARPLQQATGGGGKRKG